MHLGYRILIVDDDPGICETMKDILELDGHHVETAASGEEAVACCSREGSVYDVILLDVRMPKMNGLETLREIKRGGSSARVFMISGFEVGTIAPEALAAGAEAVFSKPVDVVFLLPLLLAE